jgi:tetratricopeptide (TPR) repeat protein
MAGMAAGPGIARKRPWVRWALVPALLALAAFGAYHGWRHVQAGRALRQARSALDRRDYDAARGRLQRCLEAWPDSVEVCLLAARAAGLAGDAAEAQQLLGRCEQLHAPHDAVVLERALLRARGGGLGGVETYLWSLVRRDHPDTPLILEVLVQGYWHTYCIPQALGTTNELLRRRPDDALALYWRGLARERLLWVAQAIADYERVLDLDPQHDLARGRLAEALLNAGRVDEARRHYEQLWRRQPDDPAVIFGLGCCGSESGQFAQAAELFERLLAANPQNPRALTERGRVALLQGKPAEAEGWLRRAVAAAPLDQSANDALAQCLDRLGRRAEAKQLQDKARRLDEDRVRLNEVIRKTVQAPHDPGLRYQAGSYFLRLGLKDEGLRWLASALQEDPGHRETHRLLAEYHEHNGNPELAASHRRLAQAESKPH